MRTLFKGTLLLLAFSLTSCTYFEKKKCEETNWYKYGYNKALSGQRVTGDTFANKCDKLGVNVRHDQMDTGFKEGLAKYCSVDGAYEKGRAGQDLVMTLCDGEKLKAKLRASHKKGRRAMCINDGYKLGKKGWVYQNHCPPKLEKKFMSNYRKGRIAYLKKQVRTSESEYERVDDQINDLERDRAVVQGQLMSVNPRDTVKRVRVYNPRTGRYSERTQVVKDTEATSRKDELQRKYDRLTDQIAEKKSQKKRLRAQARSYRDEIDSLRDVIAGR